jgi:hypothetical protein
MTNPRSISIANTRIHKGRIPDMSGPWEIPNMSASPPMILISNMKKTSASVCRSEENCLSRRNTTRVARRLSGNAGLSERALRSKGHRWCCTRRSNSRCYERDEFVLPRICQLRSRYLSKEVMIVCEHAFDQFQRKCFV